MPKVTPFLWFDSQAEDAAKLYVSVFPNSRINSVSHYPSEAPGGEPSKVMTVSFEIDGQAESHRLRALPRGVDDLGTG